MPPRHHLVVRINGKRHEIRGAPAFATLSNFLREHLLLVGTKVVCAEGDCGACSVLVGRVTTDPETGEAIVAYEVADSCILFLYQLDLCHVITVEGLSQGDDLHPVQESMVRHFGSQCGFCTPGFVMTIAGLFESARREGENQPLAEHRLKRGLSGNLCRCTGYVQILEAAGALAPSGVPPIAQLFPPEALLAESAAAGNDSIRLASQDPTRSTHGVPGEYNNFWNYRDSTLPRQVPGEQGEPGNYQVFVPASLEEAVRLRSSKSLRVVSGATDLAVQHNKGRLEAQDLLYLDPRIGSLAGVSIEENVLLIGACATWSQVLAIAWHHLPELARIIEVFGAPQIRNVATVGGNLVNASPIADSLPFLYVTGATLELAGPRGERRVAIEDFYQSYKSVDLRDEELLVRIVVPLPLREDGLKLYKMSKRRDLDISSFTAAILLRIDDERIVRARLAYGGVGPTVIRLHRTEAILTGQPYCLETLQSAATVARDEISPISDVRGSEDYRAQLAENALIRYYYDSQRDSQRDAQSDTQGEPLVSTASY